MLFCAKESEVSADQVPRCVHGCLVDRRSTFVSDCKIERALNAYERFRSRSVGLQYRDECRGWTAKGNHYGVLWKNCVDEAVLLVSLNVRKGPNERHHLAHWTLRSHSNSGNLGRVCHAVM